MKSKSITKPEEGEYPSYYAHYVENAGTNDLLRGLRNNKTKLLKFFSGIEKNKWDYAYAPGKWTVKEILLHLADAERVFAYRVLCFARKDKTSLPGFDENAYAPASNASLRNAKDIIAEYEAVRNATIALFKSIDAETALQKGIANGVKISVRAIGYSILGHELHHVNVIKERYLTENYSPV